MAATPMKDYSQMSKPGHKAQMRQPMYDAYANSLLGSVIMFFRNNWQLLIVGTIGLIVLLRI